MKEQIGQKLIQLRGTRTRDEVADAIGVSHSAIQMYENGQRIPRDEIKIRLAVFYEISVDELFFSAASHD
jgi:putative transcriptional regulator